ncbi:hypothetical protein KNN_05990 [Bacillus thuringiensis serovar tolworthi]|uniref:Uncharacterized protein n=1 Tax=Bacillus thuringiensis subsp. tolworthi TaxID=1442 RepID=A0A9W4A0Z4_BACTO|nr:hypothetical protein KNN_05990 [Bacillus thuringiensis serovar tolworthi]
MVKQEPSKLWSRVRFSSPAFSSLKTERNKQRETSIFILDARQTNFIGEFDPGSG